MRNSGPITILLLCAIAWPAGPGIAEESPAPAFATSSRLKQAKCPHTLHYRYTLAKDPAVKPGIRRGKVRRQKLYFVDVNGDGTFDEHGVDGWAFVQGAKNATDRFVFPLRDSVVLAGEVIRYRVQSDGSRVDYEATPIEAPRGILGGLAKLNELRMQNGLLPVDLDEDYSAKARKHVLYMKLNDANGHTQIKGRRGYSEDGAWAGIYSVIDIEVNLAQATERWWATLYHRRPLSDPRLVAVGAAETYPYAMLVPKTSEDVSDVKWATLVPAPGSHDIATHGGREKPLPFPDGEQVGYPITIQFPAGTSKVIDASASLVTITKKGKTKSVPAYYSDLQKPAHTSRNGNDGCICLFPDAPLRAKTTYRVRFKCLWRGKPLEHEWTFVTGRERLPPGRYAK